MTDATTMQMPEKLDLRAHDIAEDKRQALLHFFPEVCTEGGKMGFQEQRVVLHKESKAPPLQLSSYSRKQREMPVIILQDYPPRRMGKSLYGRTYANCRLDTRGRC